MKKGDKLTIKVMQREPSGALATIEIVGQIADASFVNDGETEALSEGAIGRMLLATEMAANQGHTRVHILV